MRTITQKVDLYKFDELPEEVQEKIIEKNRDYEVSDTFWSEHVIDAWIEKLDIIGFENAKISWAGFWSQGDGAFFEADCNSEKLLNTLIYCEQWKTPRFGVEKHWRYIRALAYNEAFGIDIKLERFDQHYSHENSGSISCRFNATNMAKKMYREEELLTEEINDLRRDLCQQIYSHLQKDYEFLTSDEYIIEIIKENGLEFTIDGEEY
jgi:hypothetical protein